MIGQTGRRQAIRDKTGAARTGDHDGWRDDRARTGGIKARSRTICAYVSTCFMPILILLAACFRRAVVQMEAPTTASSLARSHPTVRPWHAWSLAVGGANSGETAEKQGGNSGAIW